jgi:thiol-disulfide isomerase/thioredoxin
MAGELDIRFQNSIAASLPAVLVNPSKALEESSGARDRLADLRGEGHGAIAEAATTGTTATTATTAPGERLPVLGVAPEIRDTQRWFNTPGGRPLSLASLRGRVVLIDFWTYSCINCIRTLPELKAWDSAYRDQGLTIIGVHAPEFPFERDPGNVARAVERDGLHYPVVQDNDFATWSAYGNRYWPAKYLIDRRGRVRFTHFGEGEYDRTEDAIRSLLAEPGTSLGHRATVRVASGLAGATPESYLGAERAQRFVNGPIRPGLADFRLSTAAVAALPPHHLAYQGRWRIAGSYALADENGARLDLRFLARRVFLVLGARGGTRRVEVTVDGGRRHTVTVGAHRLYDLVRLPRPGSHLLTLTFERGVEAYAFTFG